MAKSIKKREAISKVLARVSYRTGLIDNEIPIKDYDAVTKYHNDLYKKDVQRIEKMQGKQKEEAELKIKVKGKKSKKSK